MKINRLLIITAFLFGYSISNIINNLGNGFISDVSAEVDGMDYMDLVDDDDFRDAVMIVVNQSLSNSSTESAIVDIVESNCSVRVRDGILSGKLVLGIKGYIECERGIEKF